MPLDPSRDDVMTLRAACRGRALRGPVHRLAALAVVGVLTAARGGTSETAGDAAAGGGEPVEQGQAPTPPERDVDTGATVAALNSAGATVLDGVPSEGNAVLSPVSIGHALLMARAAADDATGAAIDEALALPTGTTPHDAWATLDLTMRDAAADSEDVELSIADRIWPAADLEPDGGWVDLLRTRHGVDVQPLDLAADPSGSRETINDWVGDRTAGLIPELLPEGFVRPDTRLVLTDAIYFAARWQTPFGKYGPSSGAFTRLDGSTTNVEYLVERELGSPRGTGDGWTAAEVPYAGGAFSMLVVVPDEGRYEELRGRLGDGLLDEVDAEMTTGPFELRMPRWSTTSTIDLLPSLRALGAAPGSYPAIGAGVELGAAVHAADIAVDEQGTVAAAATAMGFEESGPPEPELTVAAERPFLYAVRHVDTGLVLFLGQVTDPS